MIEPVEPPAWDVPLPAPPEPAPDGEPDPLDPPLSAAELARFYELLDHEELAGEPADGPAWAVPGLETTDGELTDGEGRLSRASIAALGEVRTAWETLRLAQARCYRALTGLHTSDAVTETGYRSTTRLLEDHVRVDATEALRLTRHANSLTGTPTGTGLAADLPDTALAVTAGAIGPGHVEVIRTTMRRLTAVAPAIDPDTLTTTETELAGLARTHSPAALAQAAKAILALLDPDGTAPDDQPLPENELHYLRRRNGTLIGRFTYRDPAAAETLHTALSAATPPPETIPDRAPEGPRGESAGLHALRTLPERRAHALLDLAGEALTHGLNTTDPTDSGDSSEGGNHGEDTATRGIFPTDTDTDSDRTPDTGETADTGESAGADSSDTARPAPGPPPWTRADLEGGDRVALTLTLNYDTLRATLTTPTTGDDPDRPGHTAVGFTGHLGLLGENTWIRPETARRLACDVDLIPAVLGSRSEILDLGRKTRIANQALRRAILQRDRHCAHPGCRRRARRCQIHHIIHWIDHGESCPTNCVLLCAYHHTLIHHSSWHIHMVDGLPWFTPPAYIDPTRSPRHNRPWTVVGTCVA